jgi:tRNA (adenine57-N1/adenine58-N1)-methyltransferase
MPVKRVLVRKGKKAYVKELDREVKVIKQQTYYVEDTDKDFHTQSGVISMKDLKRKGKVLSSTGKEFFIFSPKFIDHYLRISRSAQIVTLKDIGAIIADTGIDSTSSVVDAGSGSGALACFLAHIAKEVTTYDIKDENLKIVRKNKAMLKLANLKVKKGDVYDRIDERNVDLVTLDLPEPGRALPNAMKALRPGGHLVVYNPQITQIADFVNQLAMHDGMMHIKTVELLERHWDIEGRKVRPKSSPFGHSGFLVISRKMG